MKLKFLLTSALVALFLIIPLAAIAQSPSPAPEKVDVYALFWPVSPGKTVADSMFFLKQLKETFSNIFSFGEISKANNQIEIAEKRFVEGFKLFEDKDYNNAFKSLELNKAARNEAVRLKKTALEKKQDAKELTTKLVSSLEKQQKALQYIQTQLPEDQKSKIDEILKELTLQISEAK